MQHDLHSLRVGVAPTRREVFSNPLAVRRKETVLAKMAEFEGIMDFAGIYTEDLNPEGLMMRYAEAAAVQKKFSAAQADALFVPHCNFGQEEAVAKLAKNMGVPVLIWGPRDPAPEGTAGRPTDSQCGLFAATKVLQRYGVKFSYIENCHADEKIFQE
ncbi:MAG: fucose isomerase, partial [Defluviitaleaceae bacterium]|nr:fucose isomerase [Defluviitaleaceae bacterium]